MLPNLIVSDELGLGVIAVGDENRVSSLISRVSAKARHEAKQTWVDPLTSIMGQIPDVVRTIVVETCLRALGVPVGVVAEGIGPTSVSYDKAAAVGTYFSADDLKILRSFRPRTRTGLWALETSRGHDDLRDVYFEDGQGGQPVQLIDGDEFERLWSEDVPT